MGSPAYSASKAAVNAITQQMAAAFSTIAVNTVYPGWCCTDLRESRAPPTPEQGADTPLWLETQVSHQISGKFFKEPVKIPW